MPKINSMRLVGVICAAALVSSTYLSYVSAQTSHIRSSVLRMHVVANSSLEADRQLKLAVKDAVTDRCGFLFRDCGSAAEAAETAQNNIGFIKYVAEDTLRKLGSSFEVSCSIGSCSFPTKRYGEDNGILTLPAGDYTALNIMIGSAEGENWWCHVSAAVLCGRSRRAPRGLGGAALRRTQQLRDRAHNRTGQAAGQDKIQTCRTPRKMSIFCLSSTLDI